MGRALAVGQIWQQVWLRVVFFIILTKLREMKN
jgi:hypothetical protein